MFAHITHIQIFYNIRENANTELLLQPFYKGIYIAFSLFPKEANTKTAVLCGC